MGTTAQKLQAIANSKAAIKAAIEAKGVSDVGNKLSDYATKISGIYTGDPRFSVDSNGNLTLKTTALDWFGDVVSIGTSAMENGYYKSQGITEIQFPKLESVGNHGMKNAFNGSTVVSLSIPKLKTVGQGAFQYCLSGSQVQTISIGTQYGLSEIGYQAFHTMCYQNSPTTLTSITIHGNGSVIGDERCFHQMARGCTGLQTVDLSGVYGLGDYGLAQSFYGCTALKTVNLKNLSVVNGSTNTYQTFSGCTALEVVDFSEAASVPALSNINAFQNTNATYKIVVPDALYSSWIAATNWSNSSIVGHIVKASEYTPAS